MITFVTYQDGDGIIVLESWQGAQEDGELSRLHVARVGTVTALEMMADPHVSKWCRLTYRDLVDLGGTFLASIDDRVVIELEGKLFYQEEFETNFLLVVDADKEIELRRIAHRS